MAERPKKWPRGSTECTATYLPSCLSISDYVESRAKEISFMEKKYKTITSNKTTLQNLPRHMRRRAASHNVKRLPRRVRQQALTDMSGTGTPTVNKRPSRKHRRKPRNLLAEYVRRQDHCTWLETHIWHAKRFHMSEQWGYMVPVSPNDKSARSSYRANNHFCIMQDISYWCCIELRGPQISLVTAMNKLTSKDICVSVEAVRYLGGSREGSTMLYRANQYPYGALGTARFLWRAELDAEGGILMSERLQQQPDRMRRLWLWVHPSCHDDVMSELLQAMNFPNISQAPDPTLYSSNTSEPKSTKGESTKVTHIAETTPMETEEKCVEAFDGTTDPKGRKRRANEAEEPTAKKPKTEEKVMDPRTLVLPFVQHHKHGQLEVISLKDNLVRFRLQGPLSNVILTELLMPADISSSSAQTDNRKWWQQTDKGVAGRHQLQRQVWHQVAGLQSPGELPANSVLALTVRDPRLFLPPIKTKVAQAADAVAMETAEVCKKWPYPACVSPLWDENVRNEVKVTKLSETELKRLRSKLLVPGTRPELGENESRIPVLLVQTPGQQRRSGTNHPAVGRNTPGWGSGWDLILPSGWAMAFWLGLVYRGARTMGVQEQHQLASEMTVPCFPQDYPDTGSGETHQQEIRNKKEAKYNRMPPAKRTNFIKKGIVAPFHYPWLKLINEWREIDNANTSNSNYDRFYVLRNRAQLSQLHRLCLSKKAEAQTEADIPQLPANVLVGVKINLVSRGVPDDFTMICLPSAEDLSLLGQNKAYGGPKEPDHPDPTHPKTKAEKKLKKKEKSSPLDVAVETVRHSCSREVIGYLSHGCFSFSAASGAGMGFVVFNGLHTLLSCFKNSQLLVLIRPPQSNQYRFAHLTVNTEV